MRKRLRKKLRLGEFRQLGFEIRFAMAADATEEAFDALLDRLIDAVEARGLMMGGGGLPGGAGMLVTPVGRESATEEDRTALRTFLEEDAAVASFEVGPLEDAWNP